MKNDIIKEVAARIQAGNKSYCGLMKLLSLRLLPEKNKEWLYTIVIQTVILYRFEKWTKRKSYKNKHLILKRKILQKIFGTIKDNITGGQRQIKNKELETIYIENNIFGGYQERKKTALTGHSVRSQNSLLRAVIEQNPLGERLLRSKIS